MSENVCFMVEVTLKKILILSIFLSIAPLGTKLKTNCRVTGEIVLSNEPSSENEIYTNQTML